MFNFLIFLAIVGFIQTLVVRAGVIEPPSLEQANFLVKDYNENSVGDTPESFKSLPFAMTEYVKDDKDCPTLDMLIGTGGEFVVNTTKILTGTIHAFYAILINDASCKDINGFRCFLRKYHEFGITVIDVGEKVSIYKKGALKVIQIFEDYFGRCKQKADKNDPKRYGIM
ncbi:uncharacterized protein LOC106661678 [Cimex lectularius]|uniref:Uncharacterized protein n=1 Tax=Cimex lectularius TaxID=79782 RepID=A0A8I6RAA3_CIMLE|nr:uncharacterized protein LOC106661678 [Cimex lectularius]